MIGGAVKAVRDVVVLALGLYGALVLFTVYQEERNRRAMFTMMELAKREAEDQEKAGSRYEGNGGQQGF